MRGSRRASKKRRGRHGNIEQLGSPGLAARELAGGDAAPPAHRRRPERRGKDHRHRRSRRCSPLPTRWSSCAAASLRASSCACSSSGPTGPRSTPPGGHGGARVRARASLDGADPRGAFGHALGSTGLTPLGPSPRWTGSSLPFQNAAPIRRPGTSPLSGRSTSHGGDRLRRRKR